MSTVTIGDAVDTLIRAAGHDPAEVTALRYYPSRGVLEVVTRRGVDRPRLTTPATIKAKPGPAPAKAKASSSSTRKAPARKATAKRSSSS